MKIKIEIDMDNSAFHEDESGPHVELSRILEELSMQVSCNGVGNQKIFDINGNCVGHTKLTGE